MSNDTQDIWDEVDRVTRDYIANGQDYKDWVNMWFSERPLERYVRENSDE